MAASGRQKHAPIRRYERLNRRLTNELLAGRVFRATVELTQTKNLELPAIKNFSERKQINILLTANPSRGSTIPQFVLGIPPEDYAAANQDDR